MRDSDAGTSEPGRGRQQEIDARVEALAQQIVEVINEAEPAVRHDLREYATDLLRGGTETADLPERTGDASVAKSTTNPLGLAILLGALAVPMLLIFAPLGLMMGAAAVVLGLVGVAMTLLRR